MMTWHVTKSPDSDFCRMGYHISLGEDVLRRHDEEICEDIVTMLAASEEGIDRSDIPGSLGRAMSADIQGADLARTSFFTKKFWTPEGIDPCVSMYEDLSYNYSASTETVRWLHDPDPQMSMFIEGHECVPHRDRALSRTSRMFALSNLNYLSSCLEEEGIVDDYAMPYRECALVGA